MRLGLYLEIKKAQKYYKEINHPGYMTVSDEEIQQWYETNANRDYDCYTVDEELRKGLDLERVDLEHCPSWMIRKKGNPEDKVIYHIHGGGFINGSARQLFPFLSFAVNHWNYNFYAVDYRLAPNYKCIDTIEDCAAGYRYLLQHYAPENIILLGESAGGNLVFSLPQKLKEDKLPMPGGIVSCSPVVQMVRYPYSFYENACKTDYAIIFGILEFVLKAYQGDLPVDHPYLSPLCGDLSNYPPVYLDASDVESLRDEARMMYVRLKEEGCEVEYHELNDFLHAQVTNYKSRIVRRKEHPLVLKFIHRVFKD